MTETEVHGIKYRIGKMSAMQQFHVMRRISPLLAKIVKASQDGHGEETFAQTLERIAEPLTVALAEMSDKDAEYVIKNCLRVVDRAQSPLIWAPVCVGEAIMFADLDAAALLNLTMLVVQENMSGFFGTALANTAMAGPVSAS